VEVTPEIAAKAEEILRSHPTADEITWRAAKYNDNGDGDVRRPQGQHKGFTVCSED